jgi:argininosuccinate synthase
MLKAHRAMESLTLDREAAHLKDELMPRYAELIYNGYWFSPEREMLQAAIDQTQGRQRERAPQALQGQRARGRPQSETTACSMKSIATFEEDAGAYDPGDATGFISPQCAALPCDSAAVARGPRLPWQAGGHHRLRRHGHDPGAGDGT